MAAPATITVFDNLYDFAGNAIVNATVNCVLNGAQETTSGGLISPKQQSTTTDGNGRFAFTVVANDLLSPINSTYTIQTPFRTYDIAPQSANGNSQQTTAANVIVTTPTPLAPATSNITGNLTIAGTLSVTGLVTAQAGLTISGGTLTIPAGGFTMAGPLTLTAAASQIIPGATSFSVRDTGNANDNLLVSNAGNVTVRGSLTVTGGGFTVSAGGATITGNSTVTGTLTVTSTINSQTISAAASFTGTVTVATGLTVSAGGATITAGDLTITAGRLVFAAATSKIVPGATVLQLRDNADANTNVNITNAGVVTLRNALLVPPIAAGSLPSNLYATIPVKLDDQSGAGPSASITLTVPAGPLYRNLLVTFIGRGDAAAGNVTLLAQFNADAGANYTYSGKVVVGSATAFTDVSAVTQTSARIGSIAAANDLAGVIGQASLLILNADSATQRKMFQGQSWSLEGATEIVANLSIEFDAGQWDNTANAMTSIKLLTNSGNFVNYRATLWGFS